MDFINVPSSDVAEKIKHLFIASATRAEMCLHRHIKGCECNLPEGHKGCHASIGTFTREWKDRPMWIWGDIPDKVHILVKLLS